MLSWEIVEHGKPLQKALKDTPKPQGTEVLMRITRSGVCHSDLHIWDGYFDLGGGKRFYVKERGCIPPFQWRSRSSAPPVRSITAGSFFRSCCSPSCGECGVLVHPAGAHHSRNGLRWQWLSRWQS